MTILQKKINTISDIPVDFMAEAWTYIEEVVVSVLVRHCDNYPLFLSSTKRAAYALILKMKDESVKRVEEIVEMERNADYTCNPGYMHVWNRVMSGQTEFMGNVEKNSDEVYIKELGKVNISHLRNFKHIAQQAYDLKVRMTAYWKIVPRRIVDAIALHLLFSIRNLVNELLVGEIVKEAMGPSGDGITRLFDESPSIASKREKLNNRIRLLKESKNVLSKIMDQITAYE